MTAIGSLLDSACVRQILEFFQPHKRLGSRLSQYVRSTHVVGHPIDPGANRATAVKVREATPKSHVNLLHKIAANVWVGLIAASQSLERRAVSCCSILVEFVLRGLNRHYDLNCAHIKVV